MAYFLHVSTAIKDEELLSISNMSDYCLYIFFLPHPTQSNSRVFYSQLQITPTSGCAISANLKSVDIKLFFFFSSVKLSVCLN